MGCILAQCHTGGVGGDVASGMFRVRLQGERGKGGYGPRPRDEGTEALIMWILAGGVGVILIVGTAIAVYKITKSYRKRTMEDLEKANDTSFEEDGLKCGLGTNKHIIRA